MLVLFCATFHPHAFCKASPNNTTNRMVVGETMSSNASERSLLRAAEQLQDAIKSVRRRRSSHTQAASMRSSPRASCSHSEASATFQDHECDDSSSNELGDKENVVRNGPRGSSHVEFEASVVGARQEPGPKQLHCERLSRQTTQSLSGDLLFDLSCLSDEDGESEDGILKESGRCSMREWERRGILRMSELSLSGMSQSGFLQLSNGNRL